MTYQGLVDMDLAARALSATRRPSGRHLIAATAMAAGLGLAPAARAQHAPAAASCGAYPDSYKDYNCLDAYLGSNVIVRL